jgi:arylsulfatase A-like enzyme
MSSDADPSPSGTVLVTVDSLRTDVVGPEVTPTLSGIAADGVAFDRAFAHGNWTPFAFPSILGSEPVFSDRPGVGLPDAPALAEALSAAGVTTAGFNAANGFLTEHWGYDRGFDRFDSFVDDPGGRGSKYLAAHPTVQGWVQLAASPFRRVSNALRGDDGPPFVDVSHLWDVERRARRFLADPPEPFFLWVHYMDAHTPYVPAPKHLKAVGATGTNLLNRLRAHLYTGLGWEVDEGTLAALRSLYRGAVHQVDASVGRLLAALEASGLRDSTTVVVTGDHGEEFGDHGHLAHYPKLYDELVRVPLLVDHPDADPRRIGAAVGHESVPTTVCSAMGVDPEPFDGPDLLPAVRGEATPTRGPVTSLAVRGSNVTRQPIPRRLDQGEPIVSARTDRYTYIYHTDSGRRELYDRSVDPDETDDRHGSGDVPGEVVDRLHAAVERRIHRLADGDSHDGESGDGKGRETPEGLDRHLEALGYQ